MSKDKIKQLVGMIGGFLGSLLLALQVIGLEFSWFTQESIDAWMAVLMAVIPLAFAVYGVWKNQYIVTDKAKKQEEELKRKGLK